jgi:23S rRNA (guanosine2251-2'-O)-methyltransferase
MSIKTITGFHAIEEYLRSLGEGDSSKKTGDKKAVGATGKAGASGNAASSNAPTVELFYSAAGPRVKKIIAQAEKSGVKCSKVQDSKLDELVAGMPEALREHRGAVLVAELRGAAENDARVSFDAFVAQAAKKPNNELSVVVVLDSVTDPHNVGAIIRSCDQFGADLVVLPERRGAKDSEVIARSSAGANAWVPVAVVPNLVRAVEALKNAGYWVYGADAGGLTIADTRFTGKVVIIMGSEGNGMGRLLETACDAVVSIPTCGKLDSLNVSVAAGILLYEIRRQNM